MMKYGAIIENALLFFAFIVFCGESFAEIKMDRENQIADLKNDAESPIKRQDGDQPEDLDGFFDILEEKLENATSTTSSSETTTAITTMLPATNESSTTFDTTTTSPNIQSTSDLENPNISSTSGSTQSPIFEIATEVSIVNAGNNSTDNVNKDVNIKPDEKAPKNNSTTLGWYSIFTTQFWKDQLYDQNYVLAIVLPIAAGISLALIVVCACCILNKLCNRQRHIHVEKKNYYGRNTDSDNKWMLLAPSSSDEEI